ncbi:MAG: hypothetical protein COA99_14080 [Moraxellaceae bacterium]|nr:MAG: hypothetical protein COA99_14080 [Moraxellaceae bacterium]
MAQDENTTVLIVDDEPANVVLLDAILSPLYNILAATNGEEALELASDPTSPCLILLDIMMPKMDGFEVIRQLKKNPQTRDIPTIFVTAKAFDKDEELGFSLGAVDFIIKPFNINTVISKVAIHVEYYQQRQYMKSLVKKGS